MTNIMLSGKTVLVTGAAGFIGANLIKRLLSDVPDAKIVGLDNLNDYYDVRIKEYRLEELNRNENFVFIKGSIADKELVNSVFESTAPSTTVTLQVSFFPFSICAVIVHLPTPTPLGSPLRIPGRDTPK